MRNIMSSPSSQIVQIHSAPVAPMCINGSSSPCADVKLPMKTSQDRKFTGCHRSPSNTCPTCRRKADEILALTHCGSKPFSIYLLR